MLYQLIISSPLLKSLPKLQPVIVYLKSYILFQLYFIFIPFLVNEETYDYGYMTYHIILYYRP